MAIYTVYTDAVSYRPEHQPARREVGGATPVYVRRVRANSRLEALGKCLPEIRAELPKARGTYLSIFVGKTHDPTEWACRLAPIQIVIATGEIR
jgi:hypothetical protein